MPTDDSLGLYILLQDPDRAPVDPFKSYPPMVQPQPLCKKVTIRHTLETLGPLVDLQRRNGLRKSSFPPVMESAGLFPFPLSLVCRAVSFRHVRPHGNEPVVSPPSSWEGGTRANKVPSIGVTMKFPSTPSVHPFHAARRR